MGGGKADAPAAAMAASAEADGPPAVATAKSPEDRIEAVVADLMDVYRKLGKVEMVSIPTVICCWHLWL